MRIRPISLAVTLLLAASLLASCSSDPKVKRIDTDEVTDLGGTWNDTDSRLVAEAMTKDLLSQSWYNRVLSQSNEIPTIIVGLVRNKSHEHIDTATFTKDIERSLINSGMIDLVASAGQREEIRDERAQQDLYSSAETRKALGEELGADMILQGSISTILDANSEQQARFYQVDLELIEIETTRKVWLGQKKIKKLIEKDRVRL